jgi:hypothetical protein
VPIVLIDGFDFYGSRTNMERRWTNNAGTSLTLVSGRLGGSCAQYGSLTSHSIDFASTQGFRVGFAFRINTIHTTGNNQIIRLRDVGTAQCELYVNASGNVGFSRNGTAVGSVSATALSPNVWYYLEWYVVIADSISTNQCNLYVDGSLFHNITSGDMKNHTTTNTNRVVIGNTASNGLYEFDDFWVSTEGTSLPTLLGDHRIVTLLPNGNGNYGDFTGSDGNSTNNFELVDETTIVDSDFVESNVVNHRDSYAITDLGISTAAIQAVAVNTCINKQDAGARTGRNLLRISGTDYESSNITLSTSFQVIQSLWLTNPATSLAWTDAAVNGLEAGIKVQA